MAYKITNISSRPYIEVEGKHPTAVISKIPKCPVETLNAPV